MSHNAFSMHQRCSLSLLLAVTATACAVDPSTTTGARDAERPSLVISDAVHSNGNGHFYFLPPLVSNPAYSGVFDGGRSPVVEICEWNGSCGPIIARFTTSSGTGGQLLRADLTAEHYIVNWDTKTCITGACTLDPAKTYRLRVLLADAQIGFADVDVVSGGSQLKNVNTEEYIPLLNGRTLPVKFRIEEHVLPAVIVANPTSLSLTAQREGTTSAQIAITNGGLDPLTSLSVMGVEDYSTGNPVPWVTAVLSTSTVPATITVTAAPGSGVSLGTHRLRFAVVSPIATNSPLTIDNVHVMVEPQPFGGYAAIDAGDEHSCALAANGAPYCWGANHVRQLGIGTTDPSAHPVPLLVNGGLHLRTLSTAAGTTCGLDAAGAAWCWGWGSDGQLGDGIGAGSAVPMPVAGGRQYTTLYTGHLATCAITATGAMYCWGHLFDIGPWPVSGGHLFRAVAVGQDFVCALDLAGAAWCFGDNDQHQFGTTASVPSFTMTPVSVDGGHVFVTTASGKHHTCALTSSGEAWCWGRGTEGQLGDGQFSNHAVPTQIPGVTFRSISASGWTTCGITIAGQTLCWGSNETGQIGDGTRVNRGTPTAIVGGVNLVTLEAGRDGGCGLTATGQAWCWGANTFGRLGNGLTDWSNVPVQVLNP